MGVFAVDVFAGFQLLERVLPADDRGPVAAKRLHRVLYTDGEKHREQRDHQPALSNANNGSRQRDDGHVRRFLAPEEEFRAPSSSAAGWRTSRFAWPRGPEREAIPFGEPGFVIRCLDFLVRAPHFRRSNATVEIEEIQETK